MKTPNLNLNLPNTGSTNWGEALNENFNKIDDRIGSLQQTVSAYANIQFSDNYVTFYSHGDEVWNWIKLFQSTSSADKTGILAHPEINVSDSDGAILSGQMGWTNCYHSFFIKNGIFQVGVLYINESETSFTMKALIGPKAVVNGINDSVYFKTENGNNIPYIYIEELINYTGFKIYDNYPDDNSTPPDWATEPYNNKWSAIDMLVKLSKYGSNNNFEYTKFPQSLGGYFAPSVDGNQITFTLIPADRVKQQYQMSYNLSSMTSEQSKWITLAFKEVSKDLNNNTEPKNSDLDTKYVSFLIIKRELKDVIPWYLSNGTWQPQENSPHSYNNDSAKAEEQFWTTGAGTTKLDNRVWLQGYYTTGLSANKEFIPILNTNKYSVSNPPKLDFFIQDSSYKMIPVDIDYDIVVKLETQKNNPNFTTYQKYTIDTTDAKMIIENTFLVYYIKSNYQFNKDNPLYCKITATKDEISATNGG